MRAVKFIDVVAADQIDSRLIGVTLPLDLTCCNFVAAPSDLHGVAPVFGGAHPDVDVLRQRRIQIRPLAQRRQRIGLARDDHLQLAAANQQSSERDLLLCCDLVKPRLCFVGIDDRLGADFEFTTSLLQLLASGRLRSHECDQLIPRAEYVEICVGHSQGEVLLRLRELRLALHDCQLGLIERGPVLRSIQRHGQVQSAAVDAVIAAATRPNSVLVDDR